MRTALQSPIAPQPRYRFAENELAPLNAAGDAGCRFADGQVSTPPGFPGRRTRPTWLAAGPGSPATRSTAARVLPPSMRLLLEDLLGCANMAWAMYPGLSRGAVAARERLQMRALGGPKAPDRAADPIIVHADVRRMLLTQRAFIEGGRALVYYAGQVADRSRCGSEAQRARAAELLDFLTPVVKGFTHGDGLRIREPCPADSRRARLHPGNGRGAVRARHANHPGV